MSTSNLIALAVLQANWDAQKDYLTNFEPFLLMQLQGWDGADPVDSKELVSRVRENSGLTLPLNVMNSLIKRATRSGYLARENSSRDLYVVPEKLEELDDLLSVQARARGSMDELLDRLVRYASEHHDRQWTAEEAEAALTAFLDELGLAFLRGQRRGEAPQRRNGASGAVALVQAFARHAFDHQERALNLLEQAVHGSMLSTVLHYERPEDAGRKLDGLVVYLDTPVIVRLLGVSLPQLSDAAVELRDLLREQKVPCRVFHHTVEEVRGVLSSTAANLNAGRSKASVTARKLSQTSREVRDHFIKEGRTAGDVESLIADLDRRLMQLGLTVEETPEHEKRYTLDEQKLSESLQKGINYRNEPAKLRDIDSLTAVHRLRKGRSYSDLGQAKAVFVTSNSALAWCTRTYMKKEEHQTGVPHVMTDIEITTQVWVRTPSTRPELPRKLLIADAYAALNPSGRLWDRYLAVIDRLQEQGTIDEEQVVGLIHSTTARSEIVDLSLGDPNAVDEDTVGEVLDRLTEHLTEPRVAEEQEKARKQQESSDQRIHALVGVDTCTGPTVDASSGPTRGLWIDFRDDAGVGGRSGGGVSP